MIHVHNLALLLPGVLAAVTIPIADETGKGIGTLAIADGQRTVAATRLFCREHRLRFSFCDALIQSVCNSGQAETCELISQKPIKESEESKIGGACPHRYFTLNSAR